MIFILITHLPVFNATVMSHDRAGILESVPFGEGRCHSGVTSPGPLAKKGPPLELWWLSLKNIASFCLMFSSKLPVQVSFSMGSLVRLCLRRGPMLTQGRSSVALCLHLSSYCFSCSCILSSENWKHREHKLSIGQIPKNVKRI